MLEGWVSPSPWAPCLALEPLQVVLCEETFALACLRVRIGC